MSCQEANLWFYIIDKAEKVASERVPRQTRVSTCVLCDSLVKRTERVAREDRCPELRELHDIMSWAVTSCAH